VQGSRSGLGLGTGSNTGVQHVMVSRFQKSGLPLLRSCKIEDMFACKGLLQMLRACSGWLLPAHG
jgi:hypothetical protein